MKIPKNVTAAKAAANKRNATNSTGPKFPRGKRFASRNATRYGIFARSMLLPGENEKELKQLRSEMLSHYCPVGARECHRVDRLIRSEVLLTRLYRAETGEITKVLADFDVKAEISASVDTPAYVQAVAVLKKFEQIEEQLNSEGRVSEENLDCLRKLPYSDAVKHFLDAIRLAQAAESEGDARPEMSPATEGERPTSNAKAAMFEDEQDLWCHFLLRCLESVKDAIREEQAHHGLQMMRRVESQRDALLIPQDALLDRLMRYESYLLRNIERDENALERMQRLRGGETVPPPPARVK
jgi:hypothetical protein